MREARAFASTFITDSLREKPAVMFVTAEDRANVFARAGKINPFNERCAVRRGRAVVPLQRASATGVVVGERVRQRIVGLLMALQ